MAQMMARTPKASYDRQAGRFLINWRFPKAVQPLTGAFFRDRFPRGISPEQAARREVQKLAEYHAMIDAARARLNTIGGAGAALESIREAALAVTAQHRQTVKTALDEAENDLERIGDELELSRIAKRLGVAIPDTSPVTVVDAETVIKAWIDERNSEDNAPKEKAIKTKRRVLAHMLRSTGRTHIGEATEADLRTYRGKLVAEGKAYDYLVELKPLFKTAKANGLIKTNPITDIELPKKVRGTRQPFNDSEAKMILEASRTADPAIRWSNWLAAFTGTINSEIFEADASEVYETESGWVFDMRGRKLKLVSVRVSCPCIQRLWQRDLPSM